MAVDCMQCDGSCCSKDVIDSIVGFKVMKHEKGECKCIKAVEAGIAACAGLFLKEYGRGGGFREAIKVYMGMDIFTFTLKIRAIERPSLDDDELTCFEAGVYVCADWFTHIYYSLVSNDEVKESIEILESIVVAGLMAKH